MIEEYGESNSYLTFKLGDELFSISVFKVIEVIEYPSVTSVPNSSIDLLGVINLRGNVIPLVDTSRKFSMPINSNNTATRVIIMELKTEDDQKMLVGAVVDQVLDVIDLSKDEIKPLASIYSEYKTEYMFGVCEIGQQYYMMIDIDKVFSVDGTVNLKNTD
jgi:purine-binding chemotaxis protein CheW